MPLDLYGYLEKNHSVSLTNQQKQAVEAINGPTLLIAVPGAGKTTVLVSRIANMVYNFEIDPKKILTITFSRAGAADMQARYQRLFAALGGGLPIFSTIHSFCFRVLKSYCGSGKSPPDLVSPHSRTEFLRGIYKELVGEFLAADLEEELISNLSYLKNAMMHKEEIFEIETDVKNLWRIYKEYDSWKKRTGVMDYDDMLSYTLTVFRKYPAILEEYRKQTPYLCVDEAQDTSKLQHAIIRLVAAPQNNIFLVGDEDQSIYAFRGTCPEELTNFKQIYPGAQVLKMEENFRCSKAIVERANIFIAQNKKRYEKHMFTQNAQGIPIQTPKLENLSDQYRVAIDLYLKEAGTVAVIYRNNQSAIALADILDRNDIDFYIKDHKTTFRNGFVVCDILAFFDLSEDRSNLAAFSRIYFKTGGYLKRKLIRNMSKSPLLEGESYFDRMIELCDEKGNTGRIRYISAMIESLKKLNPLKALDTILNGIGYLKFLEHSSGSMFSLQMQKLGVIQNLATRVKTVPELKARIDEMEQVISVHSRRGEARLTLTTAHSAKGLEFDNVVILDATEGVFPTHSAIEKQRQGMEEEMEEEARLFYVACTRAKKQLCIPYSTCLEQNAIVPSRFIFRLTHDKVDRKVGDKVDGLKLFPGQCMSHTTFGHGQIMSIDTRRETITVFFGKNGTRTLTMAIFSTNIVELL